LPSPVMAYTYDAAGNQLSVRDARDNVTSTVYDARSRVIESIAPDPDDDGPLSTLTTRLGYDPAGRLSSVKDPLGHETKYEYDERDRLIKVTAPDGGNTVYGYDEQNNRISLIDPALNHTT